MSSRYEVDQMAVARAAAILGLQYRVRVLVRSYAWGTGRYIGFSDGEHRIGVAADVTARRASRVIWHELTHASQVERCGGEGAFRRCGGRRWASSV
jgi:hypothetical protein